MALVPSWLKSAGVISARALKLKAEIAKIEAKIAGFILFVAKVLADELSLSDCILFLSLKYRLKSSTGWRSHQNALVSKELSGGNGRTATVKWR